MATIKKGSTENTTESFMTGAINEALTIDTSSRYEKLENGTEIMKKDFKFVEPIGKRDSITLYSESLIESTERIECAIRARNLTSNVICRELAKVDESGELVKCGFKNIAEYGKALFGLETSTCNHYARIGHNFINDDYSIKGGLPQLSASHFIELNAMVGEDGDLSAITELYTTGKLVDGMSAKAIRKVIKELKTGIPQKEESSDDGSGKADDVSTNDEVVGTVDDTVVEDIPTEYNKQVVVGQTFNLLTQVSMRLDTMFNNGEDRVTIENMASLLADIKDQLGHLL